jgi:hypothetical protein
MISPLLLPGLKGVSKSARIIKISSSRVFSVAAPIAVHEITRRLRSKGLLLKTVTNHF